MVAALAWTVGSINVPGVLSGQALSAGICGASPRPFLLTIYTLRCRFPGPLAREGPGFWPLMARTGLGPSRSPAGIVLPVLGLFPCAAGPIQKKKGRLMSITVMRGPAEGTSPPTGSQARIGGRVKPSLFLCLGAAPHLPWVCFRTRLALLALRAEGCPFWGPLLGPLAAGRSPWFLVGCPSRPGHCQLRLRVGSVALP